ncbi:MAG TPA: hypothetical protein EYP10_05505, partial [Armatimonadetes bacterium]|nr:hypothetical protein [Armatimonadota bacterium]
QNLPKEYGALSEHEMRFYRYAIARLAAFCNVWWDLGNEHNEYRDVKWGNSMGQLVKEWDPYDRLTSAHAYADWLYGDARWADFIITQQYGTPKDVNAWVLKYRHLNMPYINEEYGYEGREDKHGHAQNADWVRRCHWSIAMAGGYATYGIWFEGAFYTGHVGSGKAPAYLKLLRSFFERYPYWLMTPANELVNDGNFCLTLPRQIYIIYAPYGGAVSIDLSSMKGAFVGRWFNPRTGSWIEIGHANGGTKWNIHAPDQDDWVLELTSKLR